MLMNHKKINIYVCLTFLTVSWLGKLYICTIILTVVALIIVNCLGNYAYSYSYITTKSVGDKGDLCVFQTYFLSIFG